MGKAERTGDKQARTSEINVKAGPFTADLASLETAALRRRVEDLERRSQALEDQLRGLQYVKSVSDLLTGVAHDLTGALTGIVWCTEAVKQRVGEEDPDLALGLGDLVSAADYARRLARKLMSVGREREGHFQHCKLSCQIAEAASLLDVLRPRNVRLQLSTSDADTTVWACAEQLKQLLINLATNAFDAMPEGGALRLEITSDAQEHEVVLRVSDDGVGMSPEVLGRATEPFFTTKSESGGNGLGLVVVKGVVERHRARMSICSAPFKGTVVEIRFPARET